MLLIFCLFTIPKNVKWANFGHMWNTYNNVFLDFFPESSLTGIRPGCRHHCHISDPRNRSIFSHIKNMLKYIENDHNIFNTNLNAKEIDMILICIELISFQLLKM